MMAPDLDAIQARADAAAAEGYGGAWHWDGGTLVDEDHDDAVGVTRDRAAPTSVGAHVAGMDPPTTLALVAEVRAAREFGEAFDRWRNGASSRGFQTLVDARKTWLGAFDEEVD